MDLKGEKDIEINAAIFNLHFESALLKFACQVSLGQFLNLINSVKYVP